MKKYTFIIFVGFLVLSSCKKDPPTENPDFLTGDTSIFVGEWEWIYSDYNYGHCDNLSFSETITPSSLGETRRLVFTPNGIFGFYKDEVLLKNYGVFVSAFYSSNFCNLQDNFRFEFFLDNKEDIALRGCVSHDTIIITNGFTFENFNDACEDYSSYFVKQ